MYGSVYLKKEKQIRILLGGIFALVVLLAVGFLYLNRGLPESIEPAELICLQLEQGYFIEQDFPIGSVYGIGLSYARHINETASEFDPGVDPPVFKKSHSSLLKGGGNVAVPDHGELVEALKDVETGISTILSGEGLKLKPLLDYEVELGMVLLEDIPAERLTNPDFVPRLGFIVANDLSARSLAILGEGQNNRYDYWGASKSFPGFTPVSPQVWVSEANVPDAIPCVTLVTEVNSSQRQKEVTNNLIYTPREMLRFIHNAFPSESLKKGDMVLTGTPGGVTLNVPRWKSRLARLIGLDRFQKLRISQKEASAKAFLQPGDTVRVSGEWLGEVTIKITE